MQTTISELSFPEQLLIWGIRRWMAGRENWPGVEHAFRRYCRGANGLIAAAALADTVGVIAASARRPVNCFTLDCCRVSSDEMTILALIAASQAHDRHHAEAQARDLMPDCMIRILMDSAAILGSALANAQRPLPPRYAYPSDGATLH